MICEKLGSALILIAIIFFAFLTGMFTRFIQDSNYKRDKIDEYYANKDKTQRGKNDK